jgi:homocysteine S-methyltransferase
LDGARHADYLHHEVPGIELPDALRERMRASEGEPGNAGFDEALATIKALRPHVAGIHLMPPFGRYAVALSLLDRLGAKESQKP